MLEQNYFAEMQPKGGTDLVRDCNNNAACAAAAQAAGAYFGIDPKTTSTAMTAITLVSGGGDSEESTYALRLPAGYHYCRSKTVTNSIVPFTGERASVVGLRAVPDGMNLYTWTPKRGYFGPRSWVDVTITVLAVKTELYRDKLLSGECRPVSYETDILACRGGAGVNKGMNACSVFIH